MKKGSKYIITLTNEQASSLIRVLIDILKGKVPRLGGEEDRKAGEKIVEAIRKGIKTELPGEDCKDCLFDSCKDCRQKIQVTKESRKFHE
ncbi:MAG: hypothetical protein MUP17_12775 [candidate division Zixibacteria bacterium]|nr:hypothetical protein [candidate division Zixibacteria bacterium]